MIKGCRDDSVRKLLSVQSCRPEFNPQAHVKKVVMLAKKAETGWSVGVVPLPASLTYLAISKPGRYSVLKYRNKIKIQWNLLYNSRGIYSTIDKKVTSKYTRLEEGKGSKKRCLWEEMPEADRSLIATLTCMYKFCPVPNKNFSENKLLSFF